MIDLACLERVLMFFAHPDDETLAAGATIAKLVSRGVDVAVAIPGTGIYARDGGDAQHAAHAALMDDTRQAMRILGVKPERLFLGDFPDNAMDSRPLLNLVKWLETVTTQVHPQALFTHHQRCTNIDHRYCHEAAVVATRPAPGRHIALLAGEVPSSTGYLRPTAFEPNLYVAVDEPHLATKVAAMAAYGSEAQADPMPRSPEVLRALAKVRGSEAGTLFAEAFMIERAFG